MEGALLERGLGQARVQQRLHVQEHARHLHRVQGPSELLDQPVPGIGQGEEEDGLIKN